MKTSFIIPAYNEEKYIEGCLESIYKLEGLEDFEVIVVDNKSIDQTRRVVREKFPKATLLEERRKGPNWARQKGFKESRGEIVVFVDADVRLPRDWYVKITERFEHDDTLVALSGPYRYYDGNMITKLVIEMFYNGVVAPVTQFFVNQIFRKGCLFYGGDMVIKRHALDAIGGLDTRIDFFGDDTSLARELMRVGRVASFSSFWVFSSARRIKGEGFTAIWNYVLNNFFGAIFLKKVFTKKHQDIR